MMLRVVVVTLLLATVTAAPRVKTPVIIDTDVDFDDYLAMIFIMSHPDLDLLGIMVTGCGASHLRHGVSNTRRLVQAFPQYKDIPVVSGYNTPMKYSNMFPTAIRHCADIHYHTDLPKAPPPPAPTTPIQFLQDVLGKQEVGSVIILSIGGGTTLGRVLQTPLGHQLLLAKIKRVVMMGGNILSEYMPGGTGGETGNVMHAYPVVDGVNQSPYNNSVAEWNIFIDPLGAELILSSGIPTTLVALNACEHVPITSAFIQQLGNVSTPGAQLAYHILSDVCVSGDAGAPWLRFWDPLAACVVARPDLVKNTPYTIRVEQSMNEEVDTAGKIIVDDKGTLVHVSMLADGSTVRDYYLGVVSL